MTAKMPTMKPSILNKSYLCLGERLGYRKITSLTIYEKAGRGKIPTEGGLRHQL